MSEEIITKRENALSLFEEYKPLLTQTQQEIFAEYYLYDLSLSEIAENHKISKAAASDSLHKSLAKLEEYEAKLHEVSFKKKLQKAIADGDLETIKEVIDNGI